MGQNGAGKSTIFKMITGEYKVNDGRILITAGQHIAIARQVMHPEDKELTLAAYFRKYSRSDAHNIDRDIQEALGAVNFLPAKEVVFADFLNRVVKSFSQEHSSRIQISSSSMSQPTISTLMGSVI